MPKQKYTKRPDGRYRCTWTPPGTNKPKDFYGNTVEEMLAARDKYKLQVMQGIKANNNITVHRYALRWVRAHKKNVAPATFDSYVRYLNQFCQSYGDYPLKSITATDIADFYGGLNGYSKSYISKMRQTVNGMFQSAVADRLIPYDPTVSVKTPKGTEGTHRAIELWERQLIHELPKDHRMRTPALVMLYTGIRRGEALAVELDRDVDLTAKTITVREAVQFAGNARVLKDPKTQAGFRAIPLPDILIDELRGKTGLLMPSAKGAPMTESAFDRAWETLLNQLSAQKNGCQKRWYGKTNEHKAILAAGGKLPPWQDVTIRPHDLRHSYCTMLFDLGVDLKTAQKLMGHADEEVTLKIYTHLTEIREKSSVKILLDGVNAGVYGQIYGQTQNSTAVDVDL